MMCILLCDTYTSAVLAVEILSVCQTHEFRHMESTYCDIQVPHESSIYLVFRQQQRLVGNVMHIYLKLDPKFG